MSDSHSLFAERIWLRETTLDSCSDRFCAIELHDSSGLCAYMPGEHTHSVFDAYLNVYFKKPEWLGMHIIRILSNSSQVDSASMFQHSYKYHL